MPVWPWLRECLNPACHRPGPCRRWPRHRHPVCPRRSPLFPGPSQPPRFPDNPLRVCLKPPDLFLRCPGRALQRMGRCKAAKGKCRPPGSSGGGHSFPPRLEKLANHALIPAMGRIYSSILASAWLVVVFLAPSPAFAQDAAPSPPVAPLENIDPAPVPPAPTAVPEASPPAPLPPVAVDPGSPPRKRLPPPSRVRSNPNQPYDSPFPTPRLTRSSVCTRC